MIRILEDLVVNRIAAGEVVARPASALKELMENSLDAGSNDLRIALRGGGRSLIQVVDNGAGMGRDDATLCLERHATSKIRAFEDLEEVRTLGFRGEAVPSIAAVSRMELVTRPHDTDEATRVVVEGGRILQVESAGGPPGTRISVRNLFFNVPARRKFLRTVPTELGHCMEAVTRATLIRPDVDVEVTHDGNVAVRAPACEDRARRAVALLGTDARSLVPVEYSQGDLHVDALVSPVGVHRGSAVGSAYLYVNGRFVQDPVLRRAVAEAYRGIVPKGRYPLVVLELRIPHRLVDVNVHPAKTEVRFRDAREVATVVSEGVRAVLAAEGIQSPLAPPPRSSPPSRPIVPASPVAARPNAPSAPIVHDAAPIVNKSAPAPQNNAPSALPPALPFGPPRPLVVRAPVLAVAEPTPADHTAERAADAPAPEVTDRQEPRPLAVPEAAPRPAVLEDAALSPAREAGAGRLLPVARFQDLRVIGQLSRTYILCEGAGELVILDQHAAHERVTLHALQRTARAGLRTGQRLLDPPVVELPAGRAERLAEHVGALAVYGLEVVPFGGRSFAIQQVPAALAGVDPTALLHDLADDLVETGRAVSIEAREAKLLDTLACHTSVRAGQTLSPYEMRELLRALDEVDFSVCAHGRPVCIVVPPSELERRFHRS